MTAPKSPSACQNEIKITGEQFVVQVGHLVQHAVSVEVGEEPVSTRRAGQHVVIIVILDQYGEAVLSDPNKRRQYDVSGPSTTILDFEGIDVDQMGSVGRVFGALFTKLGVPIPTQISPKALAIARDIIEGKQQPDNIASELLPGCPVDGRVQKQVSIYILLTIISVYIVL